MMTLRKPKFMLRRLQKITFGLSAKSRIVSQQSDGEIAFITEQPSNLASRVVVINRKFLFKWRLFAHLADSVLRLKQFHVFVNSNSIVSLDVCRSSLQDTRSLASGVTVAFGFTDSPKFLPSRSLHVLTMLSIAFLSNLIRHLTPKVTALYRSTLITIRSHKWQWAMRCCLSPAKVGSGLNDLASSALSCHKRTEAISGLEYGQIVERAPGMFAPIAVRVFAAIAKSRDWLNDKARGAFLFGYNSKSHAVHPPLMKGAVRLVRALTRLFEPFCILPRPAFRLAGI